MHRIVYTDTDSTTARRHIRPSDPGFVGGSYPQLPAWIRSLVDPYTLYNGSCSSVAVLVVQLMPDV